MAAELLSELQPKKVLLALHNPHDRTFLRLFLELVGGYEVVEVSDGMGLIRQLKRRPDLIFLDTDPQGRFLRALEIIRRTRAVQHLPVVAYSHDQARLAEFVRKGASGLIVKPAHPASLLGKIWKLLGEQSQRESTAASFAGRYKRDIEKIDNLPTLPSVYAEVDRLCKDPDIGADELSRVIETDPSITLKLLNLANSAFFGFTRQIKSVRDAISLLGNQTVRNTILSIAIFEATKALDSSAGLDKNQFWLHSAGTGSVAGFLSDKLKLDRSESFTAGIVHDMGKIVLDALYSDFYADVLARVKEKPVSILAAEEEVIGLNHAQVGRELAESWNLPQELLDAVAWHHRPGRAERDPDMACLVHLGDVVCRRLGVGSGGDSLVPEPVPFALKRLNVSAEQLAEWESEIQETVDREKAFLSILKG